MNLEESSEGSSSSGQENGDGIDKFNGSERPLKKARFAWQVKGKYHLKNENNDPTKLFDKESTAPEIAGPSGSGSSSSNSNNKGTQQDTKTLGGYLLNKNFDSLDSVVDEPDQSVFKSSTRDYSSEVPSHNIFTPSATIAEQKFYHTRKLSSHDKPESGTLKQIYSRNGSPLKLTHCRHGFRSTWAENDTEDQCIARWQERQMTLGSTDNTINQLLECFQEDPTEGDLARLHADIGNYFIHLPVIERVENEGILMAISAHGLQNTSISPSSSVSSLHSSTLSTDFEDTCNHGFCCPAVKRSSSPLHSDGGSQHEFEYAMDNVQSYFSFELENENNERVLSPTFHARNGLAYLYENLHNNDAAPTSVVRIENDNHQDFLDAAVLFAIQSKGLTSFGTDYG